MIPLRDHSRTTTFPFITYGLIAINVLIFVMMISMSAAGQENFILQYALIPREITNGVDLFTLLTSMFLHGSWGHLIGNMLFLNIFGDNLEDYFGHFLYLLIYLVAGVAGSLVQIILDPSSSIPNLGASGAIAGLMGSYLLFFPHHQVDVLLPLGVVFRTFTVPAYTMLFYWIVAQIFGGVGQLGVPGTGGVAYFAHIGGFLAGIGEGLIARPFLGAPSSSSR